eukprot:6334943-Alexandrium_andersonii.AAC.1
MMGFCERRMGEAKRVVASVQGVLIGAVRASMAWSKGGRCSDWGRAESSVYVAYPPPAEDHPNQSSVQCVSLR